MTWQSAERVQKNDAGEYRALINGEWVPAVKAQKNSAGEYRVELAEQQKFTSDQTPMQTNVPEWGQRNPRLYGVAGALTETIRPFAEFGGLMAGGIAGAPLGPAGSVAGAGLGYGMGKQATRAADIALGNREAQPFLNTAKTAALDVTEGANMEMMGQALAPVLSKAINFAGTGASKVADLAIGRSKMKAANILRETIGDDIGAVQAALKKAPTNVTAGQAIADINLPETQALLSKVITKDPKFLSNLLGAQAAARFEKLQSIAGGANQTSAKQAQAEMKKILNKELIPILETEIAAANTAGRLAPKFESDVARFGQAATNKVEDVRRFTAAGDRATNKFIAGAVDNYGNLVPTQSAKYAEQLAQKADEVATQAAEGSLRFGEARNFAQAALQSLEAHGLKPLKTEAIVRSIKATANNPQFAGNRDIQTVLGRVADDLSQWTNSGGVIDAFALDSIRKNSVNSAIQALYPAAEKKTQKELAAKVLIKVKPVIVDAIEKAGGTGYGSYLKRYSEGAQKIAQTKLGAEAMRLYQTSPEKFIDLVEGNSTKAVEKIFGPGNYDLAKEMSSESMRKLGIVSGELKRDTSMVEQAALGEDRLLDILKVAFNHKQIPNVLNPKVAMANRTISEIEKKVGKSTMKELARASKSAKNMDQLLSTLPTSQRNSVLKAMREMQVSMGDGIMGQLNEKSTSYTGTKFINKYFGQEENKK